MPVSQILINGEPLNTEQLKGDYELPKLWPYRQPIKNKNWSVYRGRSSKVRYLVCIDGLIVPKNSLTMAL